MCATTFSQKLKIAGLLLALCAGIIATSACNTWRGAGKDVEHAGQEMREH